MCHDVFENDILTMPYGLALSTFGQRAVDFVLSKPKWRAKFPAVLQQVQSTDTARFGSVLPGEIVYEIAGHQTCPYEYFADLDGKRLYAVERERKRPGLSAAEAQGAQKMSAQEALIVYGACCLFTAIDKGVGIKGEKFR